MDDVLRIRYIHSGANAGRFQFAIYDEGVAANTTYSVHTGFEIVDASDTVRLSLSCHTASGAITGTAYNVTGGYELSTAAIAVTGLSNMVHAGFGWSGIPDQDPANGGPSANPGIVSSFTTGDPLVLLGDQISGESADPDADGFSNVQEYIAGTDPLDARSQFFLGGELGNGEVVLDWNSVSGREYDVYWSTNLLGAFVPLQTNIAWPQSAYTNQIPDVAEQGFYKIKARLR